MFSLDEATRVVAPGRKAAAGEEQDGVEAAEVLDVERTFVPAPRPLSLAGRTFVAAWIVSILAISIREKTNKSFWLAYLTNWALLSAVAYALSSWLTTVYIYAKPLDDPKQLLGLPGALVKATWLLFSLSLTVQVIVCILFWALDYEGDTITYNMFMTHGGGIVLLVIDGLVISRIPPRMKHLLAVELFCLLYIIWNVSFSFSKLENPDAEDDADDDAIYASLRWKSSPVQSAVLAVAVTLVMAPLVFLVVRSACRLLPRRLLREEEVFGGNSGPKESDEEVACEFGNVTVY